MTSSELRQKYIDFFKAKGHVQIPSASLVPENDPTVLFTTAGMHPLVPFLFGQEHPAGRRLVNYQRCVRTGDIDLVGDDVHLTFFEMLGNWSLGDYWKEDAIKWSWEFLTDKKWLGLDPGRIYITCFAGDDDAPRDEETAELWKSVGVPEERIAFLGKDDNWWGPAGKTGPCGPDTEMFYQVNTTEDERPTGTNWPKGKYVEIWNDVFMQYNKTADGTYEPLKQKNVDTGMGLERTLTVLNEVSSVYETELFEPLLGVIKEQSIQSNYYEKSARIIADHIKASVFLISDGVIPSNKEQGYILRRLIRRSMIELDRMVMRLEVLNEIAQAVIDMYKDDFPIFKKRPEQIANMIRREARKAKTIIQNADITISRRLMEIKQNPQIAGQIAFDMFQTSGTPAATIYDIVTNWYGVSVSKEVFDKGFRKEFEKHQNLSRKGAEQKFAGGLADHSERVVRMHTATHLLHQALRDVLGPDVFQKGSNITAERLRFDFSFPRKMTPEEIQKVENMVNEQVQRDLKVEKKIIPLEEAKKLSAIGLFGEKYGDTVSIYLIGNYSKEFCGGPHVEHTGQVGKFNILKEEAVSAGVRRIKATVE